MKKNFYIETFGCSINQADSETMAGVLVANGLVKVDDVKDADVVIENTCTVKTPTHNNFGRRVKELSELNKPIIITGCIPSVDASKFKEFSLLGVDQISNIFEVVCEALDGNVVHFLRQENNKRLNLPQVRRNDYIEILPISKGCLGNCNYCQTKFARGDLFSYSVEAIFGQAKRAIEEGVCEIWLTSQDCGAYGKDIGTNFVELLRALILIDGDFKIRLGMSNPNFVYEHLDELIDVFKSDKIFKFLHVPIQSASTKVIKEMNRFYTSEHIEEIIVKFRGAYPNMTLATDIIVGYPTETDSDFDETYNFVDKFRPQVINFSRFWKMDGTKAAGLKQLDSTVIKMRSKKVTDLFKEYSESANKKYVGLKTEVLVTETDSENAQSVGHDLNYKKVVIPGIVKLGKYYFVEIVDFGPWDLKGKIIDKV